MDIKRWLDSVLSREIIRPIRLTRHQRWVLACGLGIGVFGTRFALWLGIQFGPAGVLACLVLVTFAASMLALRR